MTIALPQVGEAALRKAFSRYPCGLAALSARVDDVDHVLLVATFSVGISLDPPLVSFAVQRHSTTWPALRTARAIGVSILSAGQDRVCKQISSKDKSVRWDGVESERTPSGAIFLKDAAMAFECALHAEYPAGDHDMVLLLVGSFDINSSREPLVFHGSQFRRLEAVR